MPDVRVVYARSRDPGSLLVRAASWWAPWSHVGLVTPEGTVIEARALHGVVETPLADFERRVSAHRIVEVACPDPDAALEFARSQIGSGYDWGAVVAFISRRLGRGTETRWQCAELVEMALKVGGARRWRVPVDRVTPRQSWMVM